MNKKREYEAYDKIKQDETCYNSMSFLGLSKDGLCSGKKEDGCLNKLNKRCLGCVHFLKG